MTQHQRDDDIQRREQELRQREQALRLRELEAEIMQPPLVPTYKQPPEADRLQHKWRQTVKVAKFIGITVAAGILFVVVYRIGSLIATALIVSVLVWAAYKIFWEENKAQR